ncbi:hypothetical protein COCC4DRAFT_60229 [Bipolaris maydis ATCC 48331]|uniref:HNH nuclease domain-containing protein n=1 Tax=Cochliobolus heterostrophus (strain C4 / ATCC 48331 / race T) TaxID=665024 RepID=N4XHE1_COCH4|nr:uncharacterized protein COCC4DRAFT_60229 [Bipolaris maydis ATCC 48331]KAJ5022689.1 hypothetical protein J3E73DRAFT_401244 [Bipolaris maydis]ENI05961.1 hypothetical protein COCC4DRAFT_60229 [Bipolaris maydis ATCC 48331]KAJ5064636.1 hypothetical protein J3E74DRAFT_444931 [Bipolaris maydis]KAJ6193350.1 hypothetical protein J3E72DRAFT_406792 [Bipolaris maydis]KAJ6205247.1 hypothetical protein PSV09DRAFT_2410838 [Bipolaris maydis]
MDSVAQGWTDVRPEADDYRFLQRSDERRQLFQQLKSLSTLDRLPTVFWAFFQVADIEVLRRGVEDQMFLTLFEDSEVNSALERKAVEALLLWKQKQPEKQPTARATPIRSSPKVPSNQPSSNPSPLNTSVLAGSKRTRSGHVTGGQQYSVSRHDGVRSNCKRRDGNLCAVSRMAEIDAAHIYPWCGFGGENEGRVSQFWSMMRMFWKREVVEGWQKKIFVDINHPYRGTETIENMVSLSATLHRFHSAARFALRPIQLSADKTQLELEFHWLVVEERNRHDRVDIMDEPLSSAGRRSAGRGYGPLDRIDPDDDEYRKPLKSGTRFVMATDDPENQPLPDSGLLTLQWHLQRVLAMTGAAGWKEEEFGDDDDDDKDGSGVTTRDNVGNWLQNVEPPENHRPSQNSPEWDSDDITDGSFE